jgi:hypothetical protein
MKDGETKVLKGIGGVSSQAKESSQLWPGLIEERFCYLNSKGYEKISEFLLSFNYSYDTHFLRSPSEVFQYTEFDCKFYIHRGNETRFSPDISPIILAAQVFFTLGVTKHNS